MSHAAKRIRKPDGATHGVGSGELVRRLGNARRRLRYWQTVSPSNTRKSRGEGYELAKADVERLTQTLYGN